MKIHIGNIVDHPLYGRGIVKQRWISASGTNELYDVIFVKGLCTDGLKRVLGSDLTLVSRSDMPGSGSKLL